jgi:hypothetical protein
LTFFHPLAKFPGPALAPLSNVSKPKKYQLSIANYSNDARVSGISQFSVDEDLGEITGGTSDGVSSSHKLKQL